jgi:hypothetical protein
VPGGFTVTLTFLDTSWDDPPPAGPVMEGNFTGGSWFGPVLQNITGHTETTQPSFVMRQINATTAPSYPYNLSDTNPTTVEPDFSGNWGTPYALNPPKNLAGANQNVDASNHYSYSLSFTVTQPTRFSIKGFPVLSGGTLQTLTVGASFSNATPNVTGTLSTHSTTAPHPSQILFNAGDSVRLNWTVTYQ